MKTQEQTPKRMGPRRSALTMSLAGGLTAGVIAACTPSSNPRGGSNFDSGGDGSATTLSECIAGVVSGPPPSECAPLVQCLESSADAATPGCQEDLITCFGPEYATGNIAGQCQGFLTCATQNSCTPAAGETCISQTSTGCEQCIEVSLLTCAQRNCLSSLQACVTGLFSDLADAGVAEASADASGPADAASGDGSTTVNNGTPGSCPNPTISLLFSPMYSAFVPGSAAQTFRVPAITTDGHAASWSSSDPAAVLLAPDPTTGGVLITMQGTGANGAVTIFAAEGASCGASALNITANTENDWTFGNARYNDGLPDGGTACTNCHGPTATNTPFRDVTCTPEQVGGFSDQDLIGMIVQGTVPDGGFFDPTLVNAACTDAGVFLSPGSPACATQAYAEWHSYHQWNDITAAEQPGIVCYLRSLAPASQTGRQNFGGAAH